MKKIVKNIWSEDFEIGTVDLVELRNGMVIAMRDEIFALYDDLEDWELKASPICDGRPMSVKETLNGDNNTTVFDRDEIGGFK